MKGALKALPVYFLLAAPCERGSKLLTRLEGALLSDRGEAQSAFSKSCAIVS